MAVVGILGHYRCDPCLLNFTVSHFSLKCKFNTRHRDVFFFSQNDNKTEKISNTKNGNLSCIS